MEARLASLASEKPPVRGQPDRFYLAAPKTKRGKVEPFQKSLDQVNYNCDQEETTTGAGHGCDEEGIFGAGHGSDTLVTIEFDLDDNFLAQAEKSCEQAFSVAA